MTDKNNSNIGSLVKKAVIPVLMLGGIAASPVYAQEFPAEVYTQKITTEVMQEEDTTAVVVRRDGETVAIITDLDGDGIIERVNRPIVCYGPPITSKLHKQNNPIKQLEGDPWYDFKPCRNILGGLAKEKSINAYPYQKMFNTVMKDYHKRKRVR